MYLIKTAIEAMVYSLILGGIVTVSQLFRPRLWLNDYPRAIRDAVPPRSKEELRLKLIIGIPFLIIMSGYPLVSAFFLGSTRGVNFGFLAAFLHIFIFTGCFNLFDLLILDWLIFSTVSPRYLVLEGTEGMKAYKDYLFHLRAAGKGLIFSTLGSLIGALIVS